MSLKWLTYITDKNDTFRTMQTDRREERWLTLKYFKNPQRILIGWKIIEWHTNPILTSWIAYKWSSMIPCSLKFTKILYFVASNKIITQQRPDPLLFLSNIPNENSGLSRKKSFYLCKYSLWFLWQKLTRRNLPDLKGDTAFFIVPFKETVKANGSESGVVHFGPNTTT